MQHVLRVLQPFLGQIALHHRALAAEIDITAQRVQVRRVKRFPLAQARSRLQRGLLAAAGGQEKAAVHQQDDQAPCRRRKQRQQRAGGQQIARQQRAQAHTFSLFHR